MPQGAVGEGPIVFFTAQGQQVTYPLSAVNFVNGEAEITTADANALKAWLKFLVKQGRLAPKPVDLPGDAMIVTAVEDGAIGNRITVTVEPVVDDETLVNVVITSLDVYEGLTLGTMRSVLASSPGLLKIKTVGAIEPNGEAVTTSGTPVVWSAPSFTTGTPAFTLEARRPGTETARVTAVVSNVEGTTPGSRTFTLTVTWRLSVPSVAVDDLPDVATAAAFIVEIKPPPPGRDSDYKLPMPGTVTLTGGAEAAEAKPATAKILAS